MENNEFESYLEKNFPLKSSFTTGFLMMLVDVIALTLCIFLGFLLVNLFSSKNINLKSFINYSIYLPAILLVFTVAKLYPGIMIPPAEEVKKYAISTFFSFSTIIGTILVSEINDFRLFMFVKQNSHDLQLCLAFFIAFIISTVVLPAFRELAKYLLKDFKFWGVPAAIYTDGDNANTVIDRLLKNRNLGYHPCVIIDSSEDAKESFYKDIPVFPASRTDIIDILYKTNVKTAVICHFKGQIQPIMSHYRYTITVSRDQTRFTSTQQLKDIAGIIGLSSTHNLTFKSNLAIKRLIDISLILVMSPILIPVFAIIGLLVKITSKGPIFYGHSRIGKNGKPFKCWKFRSMCINSQEMLEEILANDPVRRAEWEKERKFTDDPRVTKFGKFIRKTSLDELPQLINVLLGQMSFIGPRPVTESELDKYGEYKEYVLSVLPGLSGMWQVSGRSDTGYEERISLDTYYIQNWSVWLDIWIFIKTIWVVFNHKGAY